MICMDTPAYKELLDSALTLRDYFAVKALQCIAPHRREGRTDKQLAAIYARQAYLMADAMMAERAKK